MKIDAPKLSWTEKPNGTIISWNANGGAFHQLISYQTPICTAFIRQGCPTKWYKHPSNNPKARRVTTMTHFNQFVRWMGAEPKSIKLDELPEAEVM